MCGLQETTGIGNVFQHVGKENDIERLQSLHDGGRKQALANFQAARASSRGPVWIRFDPDNLSIPSVRDYARDGSGAAAYIQHARAHRHQICQHAGNLLRLVYMDVVTQRVEFALFPHSEHLITGVHVAASAIMADFPRVLSEQGLNVSHESAAKFSRNSAANITRNARKIFMPLLTQPSRFYRTFRFAI